MNLHRAKLGEIPPSIEPYLNMVDHDLCDAAVAAQTALLYDRNKTQALGTGEEGLIFIPI
jgi:predicted nuclease with RNAse H fold